MRPNHCPVTADLSRHLSEQERAAIKQQWIEDKADEISADLRKGRWYSENKRMTFYPRDAMQYVQELDPEESFRFDTAAAAFWLAEQGEVFDKGQMKLDAAEVLHEVLGAAIALMANELAEREYEIEHEDLT
jgi:hypothetical protein